MITVIKFAYENEELRQKAFAIRTAVFVREQGVPPALEYDEFETVAVHYLVQLADGKFIGTARHRETEKGIKLERFAILNEFRNNNIGAHLLREVLKNVLPLNKTIYLHSQLRAVPFYQRHGFYIEGDVFTEAGIEHVLMIYKNTAKQ